jgi:alpha-L-arabinofuranosidase
MQCMKSYGPVGKIITVGMLGWALSVSAQSTLNLDVGGATYKIDKALYGVLMENYGRCIYGGGIYVGVNSTIPNTNGMRNDVIEGFKECGVGCIEWPGGCFADKYHWEDGTSGSKAQREASNNGLGTDEYFQLCSLTTAYAYPTANIQSGSSGEQNAWLNYIHDHASWLPLMPFWKIGNEEWDPCGSMTQSSYQTKYNTWYEAEPAWAKTDVMHIMDGGSGGSWIKADAQYAAGKSGPFGVSYHRYTVTDWNNKGSSSGFNESGYYTIVSKAYTIKNDVDNFVGQMNQVDPNYKVALCVDEWGAWYADETSQGGPFNWSTTRDAVIAGLHLNAFNNACRRVKMALAAQPVNVIQALMLIDRGDETKMRKTPVFWVFKMMKPHQEATMVPATIQTGTNQGMPILTASASINAEKTLHATIVNTHATAAQSLTVNLTNLPAGLSYTEEEWSGEIVNGSTITSGITSFSSNDTVTLLPFDGFTVSGNAVTAQIPAHSVVTLRAKKGTAVTVPSIEKETATPTYMLAANGGKIVVRATEAAAAPIRISLFGIDGRTLLESHNGKIPAGTRSFSWQPKARVGTNTYIIKLEVEGKTVLAQRVVLTK